MVRLALDARARVLQQSQLIGIAINIAALGEVALVVLAAPSGITVPSGSRLGRNNFTCILAPLREIIVEPARGI